MATKKPPAAKTEAKAKAPKIATILAHKQYDEESNPVPEDALVEQGDSLEVIEQANVEAVEEAKKHEHPTLESHPHLFDEFGNRN